MNNLSQNQESILVFAFRYALGRTSTAPSIVVDELKKSWPQLSRWTQIQIKKEIASAIDHDSIGHSCDLKTWTEILELELTLNK